MALNASLLVLRLKMLNWAHSAVAKIVRIKRLW